MCKANLSVHFCTCQTKPGSYIGKQKQNFHPEKDRDEYLRTSSIWILKKYLGEKDLGMMGNIIGPSDKLNNELSAEYLREELNSKNCFDFNYSPAVGDNLEIRPNYVHHPIRNFKRPGLYDYLSFIYRNRKWEVDHYNVFYDRTRQLIKGKVELIRSCR